ncbi:FAD-dependent oxidoreductase [Streptococcus agalactiae]|uniref:NAD(P)/FAD-dependent oxidoreductase n=1 Tax=Streptococcus agalactiae TaxID=1311 RepID=UPI001374B903|nr:FAD-dependent oxidoreductase [Streptococcus agalactiae]KAF1142967.1 FAD-dependent oxidoreductase [Streptococcus agalactiae]KAF1239663.1 FAD-dependent oxidoreductase [Streptococcus agalactiae]
MKKIAIIGAGAVGATLAYYLSKEKDIQVTVFDYGVGQATKAAAGIISPWFSKRRNKAWYRMARLGADFYSKLVTDLQKDGFETKFYQQTGVFLLKKDESQLESLFALADKRRLESSLIGDLQILNKSEANTHFPELDGYEQLLYASGGARVEGADLTRILLEASGVNVIKDEVHFTITDNGFRVQGIDFDKLVLASGAWLAKILDEHNYQVDIRPQKGQLRDYYFSNINTGKYPVVMPEGELDIIPFDNGKVSVGASHENDMAFDLNIDFKVLDKFEEQAIGYFPQLKKADTTSERVGIRAYTSDFSPFFGPVPCMEGAYAASGLGSTGLTVGPLIGYELCQLILNKENQLNLEDYDITKYVKKISR